MVLLLSNKAYGNKDTLGEIFSHLDATSTCKVRFVCREWRKVADKQDIIDRPHFIKTSQLDDFLSAGDKGLIDITNKVSERNAGRLVQLFQRLGIYGDLLVNRGALTDLKNTNFVRLLILFSFKMTINVNPQQDEDRRSFNTYVDQRRSTIKGWKSKTIKAEGYTELARFSKHTGDVESAYTLYKKSNSPKAEEILTAFTKSGDFSDQQIALLKEDYERKLNNYTVTRRQDIEWITSLSSYFSFFSNVFTILKRLF